MFTNTSIFYNGKPSKTPPHKRVAVSFSLWSCKCFLCVPPQRKASLYHSPRNIIKIAPLLQIFSLAVYSIKSAAAPVLVVFCKRNPSTIIRRITRIIVNSINTQAGFIPVIYRPINKFLWVIQPFIANRNSSCAPIRIPLVRFIVAALFHVAKCVN